MKIYPMFVTEDGVLVLQTDIDPELLKKALKQTLEVLEQIKKVK